MKKDKSLDDTEVGPGPIQSFELPSVVPLNRVMPSRVVRVRAVRAISEHGRRYDAGDEFELTPQRAAAIGEHVETIS